MAGVRHQQNNLLLMLTQIRLSKAFGLKNLEAFLFLLYLSVFIMLICGVLSQILSSAETSDQQRC
jgi:hypothetical protein